MSFELLNQHHNSMPVGESTKATVGKKKSSQELTKRNTVEGSIVAMALHHLSLSVNNTVVIVRHAAVLLCIVN